MEISNIEILPLNIKNRFGRLYDMEAAKRIISEHERQSERFGDYFGCFNTSEDYYEYGDPDAINIKNIGFAVRDLRIEKNSLKAKIFILETPKGKELKDMIRSVVFRTSVWGFVNGGRVTVERLISIDSMGICYDPFKNII
jgi:hypothetical protein